MIKPPGFDPNRKSSTGSWITGSMCRKLGSFHDPASAEGAVENVVFS